SSIRPGFKVFTPRYCQTLVSIAPMLTKLEAVHVGRRSLLECEDQLMARAVEAAHPAIVLGPDDQVLQRAVNGLPGCKDLDDVAPIHADEVDRTIDTVISEVLEGRFQERGELTARHLA